MAIEPKRGCGYRKVGGTYLIGGTSGHDCDRLPIELTVCPCCKQGIKQSRGWTWLDLTRLVDGAHKDCHCFPGCPLCSDPKSIGEVGLLWIGERFYKTPADFDREAGELGISRRIHNVPRNFKLGETWVLLAHAKAISCPEPICGEECERCGGKGWLPGAFKLFKPIRIEKIVTASQATDADAMADLEKRGITPVVVPDDDKDHQGSVFDEPEDPKLFSAEAETEGK